MSKLSQEQRVVFEAARRALDSYVPMISDNTAAINENVVVLRVWNPGVFVVGDVRQYEGIPYKCVQAHDSVANPNWTPIAFPAGWMQYHGTTIETARPCLQPQGAHDAYQIDEYMIDGDTIYRCKVNGTVYPPSTLPASWEAVADVSPEEQQEPEGQPENPQEPEQPSIPAWKQPSGQHDAYALGAKVTHKGSTWTSTTNGNVWEPGVYGWTKD